MGSMKAPLQQGLQRGLQLNVSELQIPRGFANYFVTAGISRIAIGSGSFHRASGGSFW